MSTFTIHLHIFSLYIFRPSANSNMEANKYFKIFE
ncbi:hypothetical protein LINGRAHAP2_LOCUS7992, partial [Linum grandiflorum]